MSAVVGDAVPINAAINPAPNALIFMAETRPRRRGRDLQCFASLLPSLDLSHASLGTSPTGKSNTKGIERHERVKGER